MAKGKSARVTLSRVATDAGVALSTASVILSENSTYLRNFSQVTIQRVRESAEKLGYRPSLFASGLPSKGSSLFFVIAVHDLNPADMAESFQWGFDGDLLGGVAEKASQSRVYPIIALYHPETSDHAAENLDRIIGGGAFGAIVRSPSEQLEKQLRTYTRQSRPVVVVFPRSISDWPSNAVEVDNLAMGEQAGQLLAQQNRKQWIIIVDEEYGPHRLRLRGFRTLAAQHGSTLRIVSCPIHATIPQAASCIAPHFSQFQPDGIFALTSRTADGVLEASAKMGIRIGQETLLIGCDCSVWRPRSLLKITSLEASWRQAGHTAMQMLLTMREEGKARSPKVLLNPVLVPGETCPADPHALERKPQKSQAGSARAAGG